MEIVCSRIENISFVLKMLVFNLGSMSLVQKFAPSMR